MSNESTKKCPKCSEEILKSAKRCKHCQADLRSWFIRHPIYSFFLFCCVLGIVMAQVMGNIDPATFEQIKKEQAVKNQPTEEDFVDAAAICAQEGVENKLKSPSSAKFPWELKAVRGPDGNFIVENYVDAQNSFGAMIRSNYRCEVQVIDPRINDCIVKCKIIE